MAPQGEGKVPSLKDRSFRGRESRLNLMREEARCWVMRRLEDAVTDFEAHGAPAKTNVLMVDLRSRKDRTEVDPLDLKGISPGDLYHWAWHAKADILSVLLQWCFPEHWAMTQAHQIVAMIEQKERSSSKLPFNFFVLCACGDDPWKEGEKTKNGGKPSPNFSHSTVCFDFMGLASQRWERKTKLGLADACQSPHEGIRALETRLTQVFGSNPPPHPPGDLDIDMGDELLAAQLGLHREWAAANKAAKAAASEDLD